MKPAMTILFCLISATALAQPKPGTYTGVRECKGTSGSVEVDATSKKTIGVATCKTELGKKLAEGGACTGKRKGTWVEYSFKFGKDGEPNQATGTGKLACR
jgi:hypothetical protein